MRDKIFVKEYVRTIEIGAFQEERATKQEVVFHLEVELNPQRTELDIVDDIVSYDVLVDAIDATVRSRRYNLLETMAEDIASIVLTNKKVHTAHVFIEKLGRIDGRLGVQISRLQPNLELAPSNETDTNLVFINPKRAPQLDLHSTTNVIIPILLDFPSSDEISRRAYTLNNDALAWQLSKQYSLSVVDNKVEAASLIARKKSFIRALGKQPFDLIPPLEDYSEPGLKKWHQAQLATTNTQDLIKVPT